MDVYDENENDNGQQITETQHRETKAEVQTQIY